MHIFSWNWTIYTQCFGGIVPSIEILEPSLNFHNFKYSNIDFESRTSKHYLWAKRKLIPIDMCRKCRICWKYQKLQMTHLMYVGLREFQGNSSRSCMMVHMIPWEEYWASYDAWYNSLYIASVIWQISCKNHLMDIIDRT